jgi:hypothetical protein
MQIEDEISDSENSDLDNDLEEVVVDFVKDSCSKELF